MKKQKDKDQRARGTSSSHSVRDWQPLFGRLQETVDWALDLAKHLAGDIDEDVEAIERTRNNLHAWLEGRRVDIDMNDVLTSLAVLFAAIEIDLDVDSSPIVHSLSRVERMLHLPGAPRNELPTVVIRTALRRRNSPCGFPQLAA